MGDAVIDGDALRRLREARGLTGRELARAADVDHSVISRLERGVQRDMSVSVLLAVVRILRTPIDSLLATPLHPVQGEQRELTGELRAEISTLGELPSAYQRHLAGLLRAYRSGLPTTHDQQMHDPQASDTTPIE